MSAQAGAAEPASTAMEAAPAMAGAPPPPQAEEGCNGCVELARKLARSEEKRERMRTNLHKFRERMIDTAKLLSLYESLRKEKLELEERLARQEEAAVAAGGAQGQHQGGGGQGVRAVEVARRQRAEDRQKLEEAQELLLEKDAELKDLHTIN
jgi:hypothetical protein